MSYRKMNPTRAVSLGIGAFALIGVLVVGSGGGSRDETASVEADAAEYAAEQAEQARAARRARRAAEERPAEDGGASEDYDAWVESPDSEDAEYEDGDRRDGDSEEGGGSSDGRNSHDDPRPDESADDGEFGPPPGADE